MTTPTLILGGMAASGKSTIGRIIASKLNLPFHDTDDDFEKCFGPVGEFIDTRGRDVFRRLEYVVAIRALRNNGIVSLGGGIVELPKMRSLLPTLHTVVLTVKSREGLARIRASQRHMAIGYDGTARDWARFRSIRLPLWKESAALIIDDSEESPEETAERILTKAKKIGWL